MLEILVFLGALGGVGARAEQRGLDRTTYVGAAAAGWVLFFILGVTALGPLGLLLRWCWVGGVFVFVETSHGGAKVSDASWQCPDCRLFNDGRTLVCLCGYRHPESPLEAEAATESAGESES